MVAITSESRRALGLTLRSKSRRAKIWLIPLIIMLLSAIIFFHFLSRYLLLCVILFGIVSGVSITKLWLATKTSPQRILRARASTISRVRRVRESNGSSEFIWLNTRANGDFFDPGFLFIVFTVLNILPIALSFLIGMEVIRPGWFIADKLVFSKAILAHAILLCSFTLVYSFLCHKPMGNSYHYSRRDTPILYSYVWVWIYVLLFLFALVSGFLTGTYYTRSVDMVYLRATEHGLATQQFFGRLSSLVDTSAVFALGVIVSRARNLMQARIRLLIITVALLFCSFVVLASRGQAIILISAGAYADIVRWKGKLLNWWLFLLVFIGGWLAMHVLNMLEAFFLYDASLGNLAGLFTALEPRILENAGVIISWVDSAEEPLRYGSNYLTALKNLIPTQIRGERLETLPEWFIWKLSPSQAEAGVRFAFSAVAEGYLNAKIIGVAVHGAVMALFAAGIKYIKILRKMRAYGPLFYSVFIPLVYKLLRTDTLGIVKKVEWTVILVILLIIIANIIIKAGHGES